MKTTKHSIEFENSGSLSVFPDLYGLRRMLPIETEAQKR